MFDMNEQINWVPLTWWCWYSPCWLAAAPVRSSLNAGYVPDSWGLTRKGRLRLPPYENKQTTVTYLARNFWKSQYYNWQLRKRNLFLKYWHGMYGTEPGWAKSKLCKTYTFSVTVPNILLLPCDSQFTLSSYTLTTSPRCFWYSNISDMSTWTFLIEPSLHGNSVNAELFT